MQDSFDPRAGEEKKDSEVTAEQASTAQRNTVAEFEALLRRVDIQYALLLTYYICLCFRLAEVQNGLEDWKLERGDTGDAGRDLDGGDEVKEEQNHPSSSNSTGRG